MLTITREQQGSTLILRLKGDVLEDTDFEKSIGATAPDTVLDCKEIARINSVGVKRWIMYFEAQRAKGTQLRFRECSPAVVEQLNLIRNFACGGKVESLYVPFACAKCKKNFTNLHSVADIKAANLEPPAAKCPHCGGAGEFDDLPEEYFRFIDR